MVAPSNAPPSALFPRELTADAVTLLPQSRTGTFPARDVDESPTTLSGDNAVNLCDAAMVTSGERTCSKLSHLPVL